MTGPQSSACIRPCSSARDHAAQHLLVLSGSVLEDRRTTLRTLALAHIKCQGIIMSSESITVSKTGRAPSGAPLSCRAPAQRAQRRRRTWYTCRPEQFQPGHDNTDTHRRPTIICLLITQTGAPLQTGEAPQTALHRSLELGGRAPGSCGAPVGVLQRVVQARLGHRLQTAHEGLHLLRLRTVAGGHPLVCA